MESSFEQSNLTEINKMNTLNHKATTVMKIKSKTENKLYYISTFVWGVVSFVTGCLFLFGMGIISLENWPF